MFDWIIEGIMDFFHWMGWTMFSWLFTFLGNIFGDLLNLISSLISNILKSPVINNIFNTIQKFSYEIIVLLMIFLFITSFMSFKYEKIKDILKNTLTTLLLITFLIYPANALLVLTDATVQNDFLACPIQKMCQETKSDTYAVSLSNAFIWEVDENGIVQENEVIEKVEDIPMSNPNKDINEKYENGTYKYQYMNFLFSFLILVGIWVLMLIAVVTFIIKILEILWTYMFAPLILSRGIISGTESFKSYFTEMINATITIGITIFTFAFFGYLMQSWVSISRGLNFTLIIGGIIAIALFMIVGPKIVVKLMGVDSESKAAESLAVSEILKTSTTISTSSIKEESKNSALNLSKDMVNFVGKGINDLKSNNKNKELIENSEPNKNSISEDTGLSNNLSKNKYDNNTDSQIKNMKGNDLDGKQNIDS